jgi:hypothetical protein
VDSDLYDDEGRDVCEYIGKNYQNHCISGISNIGFATIEVLPLKIIFMGRSLRELENKKYAPTVQYLHAFTSHDAQREEATGWDRYQEIFDQCTNLKAIELSLVWTKETISDILPTLSTERQQIWQTRIEYFEKRGIHVAKVNEIYNNQNLKNKLAKEAGISWRFKFS